MFAIEFNATVRDGKIEIPTEYKQQFSAPNNVKVILLKREQINSAKAKKATKADFGFGALSRYANADLWAHESHAAGMPEG